jgi:ribonuclease HI
MKEYLENENTINFHHVRAHVGELYNERVDDLARITAEKGEIKKFNGKIYDYLND